MLGQIALLVVVYRVCLWFVEATGLPIPANVLGIVVLFTLLALGVVKESYVGDAASFLLKHLVFFFIPITVGLMDWGAVFARHALVMTVAILVSSLLPLLVVGWLARVLRKEEKPCK